MDKNLTHPEIATNLSNAAFTLAQTNNFLFLGYSKAEAVDYPLYKSRGLFKKKRDKKATSAKFKIKLGTC
jgi:hypothetical protein